MPVGTCNSPVCWKISFDVSNATVLVMKPKDVPNWNKGVNPGVGAFPNETARLFARLNDDLGMGCENGCVCLRLNKRAIVTALAPMFMETTPGGRDLYMQGIQVRYFWGMCLPRNAGVRVKTDDGWVNLEDLPDTDILTLPPSSPPSPGGGSGHKKKKGKKGKTRRRR